MHCLRHPLSLRPNAAAAATAATAALAVAAAAALALAAAPAQAAPGAGATKLQRGQYLVGTTGCGDCHTPLKRGPHGPEPDAARALSGHPQNLAMPPAPALPPGPWAVVSSATHTAWAGPWGVSFTANLTPDAETGLGRWSEQDFKQTLRTGHHLGVGRAILPPMPSAVYQHFTDADLAAIHAYLRSVPAVSNRVPAPLPPAAAGTAAR